MTRSPRPIRNSRSRIRHNNNSHCFPVSRSKSASQHLPSRGLLTEYGLTP
jgi:uncharacterized C2H2 Zn-finger protein